jgi:hypothetical protein
MAWNMASHINGRTQLKVCPEQDDNKIFGTKRGQVAGYWRILCSGGFTFVLLTRYYWDDRVKKDEKDGACDAS